MTDGRWRSFGGAFLVLRGWKRKGADNKGGMRFFDYNRLAEQA